MKFSLSGRGPWFWVWFVFMGLVFVYLAVSGASLALTEEWKDLGQEKVFTSERVGEGVVVGRAWVEPKAFRQGEEFRCWISLENRSNEPAAEPEFATVQVLAQVVDGGMREPGELEARANGALAAALRGAPRKPQAWGPPPVGNPASPLVLPPRGRVTFWLPLEAPQATGQYDILLLYQWEQGGKWADNSIVLGPLQVPSLLERLEHTGAALTALIKDLGLPLILFFLPFLLATWEKEREKRRQHAEDVKVAKRQEAEQHSQQARETWARMLIISHRAAKQHYLPLLSTLRELSDRLEFRDRPAWQEEAFFQLMTLLVLMKRLRDRNGGFYLKSRLGEDILSGLWKMLRQACETKFGLATYTAALDEMGGPESYAAFSGGLTSIIIWRRPNLRNCQQAFRVWNGQASPPLRVYLPVLRLFYHVLLYETNRAYVYWYGTVEEPPSLELEEWREQLAAGDLGHAAWDQGILAELWKYEIETQESYVYLSARLKSWISEPENTTAD